MGIFLSVGLLGIRRFAPRTLALAGYLLTRRSCSLEPCQRQASQRFQRFAPKSKAFSARCLRYGETTVFPTPFPDSIPRRRR